MTSSEHSSYQGSIGSKPPSLAHSRESSILSTPPTEVSLPQPVGINENVDPKGTRTPSSSPPNLPNSIPLPAPIPMPATMPATIRRISQLSNSSDSSAHLKYDYNSNSNISSNLNPNHNPDPNSNLPLLQVIDQSGNEVIDPTLRDEFGIPPPISNQSNKLMNEVSLPPLESNNQILNSNSESINEIKGNFSSTQNQIPSIPLTQWPNLPSLNLYSSSGSTGTGIGGSDTQPSTEKNSPTSPTGASGLWPNGYQSLNGSLTDLSSNFGGDNGQYTPDQGLSENENYSENGFDFDNNNHNANRDEQGGAGVPAPKKKSHARKQPEGHIKRARNAFILFRKHITDSNLIPPSVEVKHQNISVVAAKMWKEAPLEVRAKFNEQARIEKEEHAKKYPGYRYQPVFRRTDIIRRRVRKDPAEDEKVDAVAEALIKGKSGGKLEEEIKEQIIQKGNESDVTSEGSSSSRSRSRRRRDVGQLSKGALRAQKAQARAKQLRQNLLGTNLLNISLYNAATNRLASHPSNPNPNHSSHHHSGYSSGYPNANTASAHYGSMYGHNQMDYMQIGYDVDGRPIHQLIPPQQGYPDSFSANQGGVAYLPEGVVGGENEMYRLPPIEGMMEMNPTGGSTSYENWQAQAQAQAQYENQLPPVAPPGAGGPGYWEGVSGLLGIQQPEIQGYENQQLHIQDEDYCNSSSSYNLGSQSSILPDNLGNSTNNGGNGENEMEYRLPPLIDIPRQAPGSSQRPGDLITSQYMKESLNNHSDRREVDRIPSQSKDGGGQQTPSGHVLFNEGLFDGALGTAGLNGSSSSSSNSNSNKRIGNGNDDLQVNGLDDVELGMFDQAMEQAGSSW